MLTGMFPSIIRCASPSMIADLPTPGSPTSTGLFFVRRLKIWMTRSISFSLPIIGSIRPCLASSVTSRATESKVGVILFGDTPEAASRLPIGVTAFLLIFLTDIFPNSTKSLMISVILILLSSKIFLATLSSSTKIQYSKCSDPVSDSLFCCANNSDSSSNRLTFGEKAIAVISFVFSGNSGCSISSNTISSVTS